MNERFKRIVEIVTDCFYPHLNRLPEEAVARESQITEEERARCSEQIAALPRERDALARYLERCVKLLGEAAETRRSVEARLTSTIGLSSIAGTLVFGGVLALATGTLQSEDVRLRVLMAIGALYLVLQICFAVGAAIHGLERQAHLEMNFSEVLPSINECETDYIRRQIRSCALILEDYRTCTNDKVSHMAVAHRAMANFVGGLAVLAVLGTCFALSPERQGDRLERALRDNHTLYQMLRGPEGPMGPPGPQGPKGQPARGSVSTTKVGKAARVLEHR